MKETEKITEIVQDLSREYNLDTSITHLERPARFSEEFQIFARNNRSALMNSHRDYPLTINEATCTFRVDEHELYGDDAQFIIENKAERALRECREMLSDFTACGHYLSHQTHGYYCDKCERTFRNEDNSHKGALYSLAKAMTTPCKS